MYARADLLWKPNALEVETHCSKIRVVVFDGPANNAAVTGMPLPSQLD